MIATLYFASRRRTVFHVRSLSEFIYFSTHPPSLVMGSLVRQNQPAQAQLQ